MEGQRPLGKHGTFLDGVATQVPRSMWWEQNPRQHMGRHAEDLGFQEHWATEAQQVRPGGGWGPRELRVGSWEGPS